MGGGKEFVGVEEVSDSRVATIRLLPKGGRDKDYSTSQAMLLFAPDCVSAGAAKTSCELRAVSGRILSLGEDIEVEVRLTNNSEFQRFSQSGQSFRLYEGSRLVGHGRWD